MSNNDIDRAFIKLKALSQKKGYLLFDDLNLFLNQRRIFFLEKLASFPLFEGFFNFLYQKPFCFFFFWKKKSRFGITSGSFFYFA